MKFGERLAYLRKSRHLTLEALAKMTGIKHPSLSKYELALINNIPLEKISIIANVYNINPLYLFDFELERHLAEIFRENLGNLILDYNNEDIRDSGVDIDYLTSISEGSVKLTYGMAFDVSVELGVKLDDMFSPQNFIEVKKIVEASSLEACCRGVGFYSGIFPVPSALLSHTYNSDKIFALKYDCRSVDMSIPAKRSYIIVTTDITLKSFKDGDFAVFSKENGDCIVKQIFKFDRVFVLRPCSSSPEYSEHIYNIDEFESVVKAKVIAHMVIDDE